MPDSYNGLASGNNGVELKRVTYMNGKSDEGCIITSDTGDEVHYRGASEVEEREFDERQIEVQEEDDEETKAPDGGWGWWIVIGSFLVHILIGGFYRSNGVFYLQMKEKFNRSATATAWVLSVFSTVRLSFAPISSAVSNRFSIRFAVIMGSAICTLGVFLSAFVPDIYYLYFTYGILGGLGRAFTYSPGLVIVGHYFNKRRGIAVGLATSGVGLGSFTFPPLIETMFETYGFSGTYLILAAVTANFFVCGALFRPLELHRKIMAADKRKRVKQIALQDPETKKTLLQTFSPKQVRILTKDQLKGKANEILNGTTNNQPQKVPEKSAEKKPLFEFSLFRNYGFFALCMQLFLYTLSFNTTFVFLPALAKEKGISTIEGAYLVSILGICDMCSRIGTSAILDLKFIKPYRLIIYNVVMFINAGVSLLLPSMKTFWHFGIVCGLYGIMSGTYISQKSVVLVDMLGVEKLTNGFGLMLVFQGIGSLIGPTVGGLLKDFLGSYDMAFYFGTIGIVAGGLMMASGNIWFHKQKSKSANLTIN